MASSIKLVDNLGELIDIEVLQDGKSPDLVRPGDRVRFALRTRDLMAFRVDKIVIDDPDHWIISDILINGRSQISGEAIPARCHRFHMETVQAAMPFAIEVAYAGMPLGSVEFHATLTCAAFRS